jgi:hypothetical protein
MIRLPFGNENSPRQNGETCRRRAAGEYPNRLDSSRAIHALDGRFYNRMEIFAKSAETSLVVSQGYEPTIRGMGEFVLQTVAASVHKTFKRNDLSAITRSRQQVNVVAWRFAVFQ